MKHFVCKTCGNLVAMINDSGRRIGCCGVEMGEVVPSSTDASREKHTPVISRLGNTVTVYVGEGDMTHPMTPEHYVSWVCLVTDKGSQRKMLTHKDSPLAVFLLEEGEQVINAFAYCNIHGLWVDVAKWIKS